MQKKVTKITTESYTLNFEHTTTKEKQDTMIQAEEYTIKEEESREKSLKFKIQTDMQILKGNISSSLPSISESMSKGYSGLNGPVTDKETTMRKDIIFNQTISQTPMPMNITQTIRYGNQEEVEQSIIDVSSFIKAELVQEVIDWIKPIPDDFTSQDIKTDIRYQLSDDMASHVVYIN